MSLAKSCGLTVCSERIPLLLRPGEKRLSLVPPRVEQRSLVNDTDRLWEDRFLEFPSSSRPLNVEQT